MNNTQSPPTSLPTTSSSRKVKSQPPRDPQLFATQQEWEAHHEMESTNVWHHLPLALVALPPLLSIIHGRAENWSDAILLLLVAFYLYQLVKVPWEMYYASHTRRVLPSSLSSLSEDPSATLERTHSASLLRRNELLSLISTALVPVIGSYLLHYVRGLLSDPDRYINDTLINLFAIATTVKPMLHIVELLKNHSLYHQSLVHYPSTEVHLLTQRISKLESDLLQLSRAFATKSDIRALRDGVDVPLSQLSKAVKRFSRREEYSRLTSEERFEVLSSRLDESLELSREQQGKLEELERERKRGRMRGGENEFASLLGRMLGLVFAGPPSYSSSSSRSGRDLGWYEKGLLGFMMLPIRVPVKTVGWAVEKGIGGLRGVEKGWEEEKELKMGGAGGGTGKGGGGLGGQGKRRNNVLKG